MFSHFCKQCSVLASEIIVEQRFVRHARRVLSSSGRGRVIYSIIVMGIYKSGTAKTRGSEAGLAAGKSSTVREVRRPVGRK